MSRKTEVICLVMVLLSFSGYHVILYARSLQGPTVTKNSDGYVSSITGLVIESTSYNVTFTYGKAFNDVFGAGDLPAGSQPVFNYDGSDAARAAIKDALTSQKITNDGTAPNALFIPYQKTRTVNEIHGVNVQLTGAKPGRSRWIRITTDDQVSRAQRLRNHDGWAKFEPVGAAAVTE